MYVHEYGCAFVKLMNVMVGPVECFCEYEWPTLHPFSFSLGHKELMSSEPLLGQWEAPELKSKEPTFFLIYDCCQEEWITRSHQLWPPEQYGRVLARGHQPLSCLSGPHLSAWVSECQCGTLQVKMTHSVHNTGSQVDKTKGGHDSPRMT